MKLKNFCVLLLILVMAVPLFATGGQEGAGAARPQVFSLATAGL